MNRKIGLGMMFLGLLVSVGLLLASGCSVTATSTTTPATPPSGTTTIEVGSGGSASVETGAKGGSAYLVVLDQNQNPISGSSYLNINNITIDIWATGVATQSATVVSVTAPGGGSAQAVTAALTLDRSGSMSYYSNASLEAAALAFVANMGATDQAAIINFDDQVKVDQALTSNKQLLYSAISNESTYQGGTSLYDSIGVAIVTAEAGSNPRKAVIAMTDGGEWSSVNPLWAYSHYIPDYSTTKICGASMEALVKYANDRKVPIYTVGLAVSLTLDTNGNGIVDDTELGSIASETGGIYYKAVTGADMKALYSKISSALTSSWALLFNSPFTFTAGHTYYVRITVTYAGGIVGSTLLTITI